MWSSEQSIYWGVNGTDITSLSNLNYTPYVGTGSSVGDASSTVVGQSSYSHLPSDKFSAVQCPHDTDAYYYSSSSSYYQAPSPYLTDGSRNPAYYQTSSPSTTSNALADFDGVGNTKKIIALRGAKDYSSWLPTYNTAADYPAASCCDMFYTDGTKQGDWYLPACGELGYIMPLFKKINQSINVLRSAYGDSVGVQLDNTDYRWSSSEYSSSYAIHVYMLYGKVDRYPKSGSCRVRAWLRVSDTFIPSIPSVPSTPQPTITWSVQSGSWTEGTNESAYDGKQFTSVSPGSNGSTVIRCTFSNVTSITFNCVYNGENNYDYLTVGALDTACTRTSYGTSLKGTSGTAKDITFTCDGGEHYVEFCYSKDGSVDTSPDCAVVYLKELVVGSGSDNPSTDLKGIYIQAVDGTLYTESQWDGSKTPNGIAVITDNCRFMMALTDAHSSYCGWGSYGTEVTGITTTTSESTAQGDYDGEAQTTTILNQLGNSSSTSDTPAAYYCRAYTFPNGATGYMGAAGEWQAALDNKAAIESALSKCGGTSMNGAYWTSTQYSSIRSWYMFWFNESLFSDAKNTYFYVRAFAALETGGRGELISFTISTKQYQAEEGMTWEEFVNSSYNDGYFSINGDLVRYNGLHTIINEIGSVNKSEVIEANYNYNYYTGGGGIN